MAGAGALVLVGWALGSDALTAMGTGYYPMAPNTALLFALLGSALLAREVRPGSRIIHRIATAAALFSAVVGSMTLIRSVIGLNIDDWLFRTRCIVAGVQIGRMALVTACCFVLASVSLLQLEWQARRWAAILGVLIALVGTVCLMGYWYGTPLLYGGSVIPVALPTSLALVALGVGLTAAAGPNTWPLNTLIGPSTCARLRRPLLPLVVLLTLIDTRITAALLGQATHAVVIASALTAIAFLLVVSYAVTWASGAIGDAVDRAHAERRQAEEELRESEQRFALFMDHLPGPAFIKDDHGRYVYMNDVCQRVLGVGSDWRGQTDEDLGPVELARQFREADDRVRATRATLQVVEHVPPTPIGHDWLVTKFLIPGPAGGCMVGGIAIDVTERQRADEALRRSERRYRDLFEQSVAGVFRASLDGAILEANDAGARMFGFASGEEFAKRNAREFWRDPRDRASMIERLKAGLVIEELPLRRSDGRDIDVLGHIRLVLDARGEAVGLEGTLIDITERKRTQQERDRLLEEVRNERQQLEALSRRLVALQEQERRAIARELHDQIGQLLTGLKLLAESGRGKDELLEVVSELIGRVRRLSLDLRPPMLDSLGLVPALLWHLDRYAGQAGVRVDFRELGTRRRYSSDTEIAAFRIVQEALTNIARHAGVREASVQIEAGDERLRVQVEDRGSGFDPASVLAGAGNGLTGMQERAELLGGRVSIDSRPGRGTRVEAELPATDRGATA